MGYNLSRLKTSRYKIDIRVPARQDIFLLHSLENMSPYFVIEQFEYSGFCGLIYRVSTVGSFPFPVKVKCNMKTKACTLGSFSCSNAIGTVFPEKVRRF